VLFWCVGGKYSSSFDYVKLVFAVLQCYNDPVLKSEWMVIVYNHN